MKARRNSKKFLRGGRKNGSYLHEDQRQRRFERLGGRAAGRRIVYLAPKAVFMHVGAISGTFRAFPAFQDQYLRRYAILYSAPKISYQLLVILRYTILYTLIITPHTNPISPSTGPAALKKVYFFSPLPLSSNPNPKPL